MRQLCADLEKIKEIVDGMYDHDLRTRLQHVVNAARTVQEALREMRESIDQAGLETGPRQDLLRMLDKIEERQ